MYPSEHKTKVDWVSAPTPGAYYPTTIFKVGKDSVAKIETFYSTQGIIVMIAYDDGSILEISAGTQIHYPAPKPITEFYAYSSGFANGRYDVGCWFREKEKIDERGNNNNNNEGSNRQHITVKEIKDKPVPRYNTVPTDIAVGKQFSLENKLYEIVEVHKKLELTEERK